MGRRLTYKSRDNAECSGNLEWRLHKATSIERTSVATSLTTGTNRPAAVALILRQRHHTRASRNLPQHLPIPLAFGVLSHQTQPALQRPALQHRKPGLHAAGATPREHLSNAGIRSRVKSFSNRLPQIQPATVSTTLTLINTCFALLEIPLKVLLTPAVSTKTKYLIRGWSESCAGTAPPLPSGQPGHAQGSLFLSVTIKLELFPCAWVGHSCCTRCKRGLKNKRGNADAAPRRG